MKSCSNEPFDSDKYYDRFSVVKTKNGLKFTEEYGLSLLQISPGIYRNGLGVVHENLRRYSICYMHSAATREEAFGALEKYITNAVHKRIKTSEETIARQERYLEALDTIAGVIYTPLSGGTVV